MFSKLKTVFAFVISALTKLAAVHDTGRVAFGSAFRLPTSDAARIKLGSAFRLATTDTGRIELGSAFRLAA